MVLCELDVGQGSQGRHRDSFLWSSVSCAFFFLLRASRSGRRAFTISIGSVLPRVRRRSRMRFSVFLLTPVCGSRVPQIPSERSEADALILISRGNPVNINGLDFLHKKPYLPQKTLKFSILASILLVLLERF